MSYMYDPSSRRRRSAPSQTPRPPGMITLEDYAALDQAYGELRAHAQKLAAEVAAGRSELAIKDDALHKQAEDLRQTQSELLWTRAALEQAQKAAQPPEEGDWQERYMRLQAEVENLRRRWEQRSKDDTAEARDAILRDMLPLADHLEMALQHAASMRGEDLPAFVANIETTERAFLETLRRYGVERQQAQGQPFDPYKHEAVGQIEAEGVEPGNIAQVIRSGYDDGERVLRPARVLVSR